MAVDVNVVAAFAGADPTDPEYAGKVGSALPVVAAMINAYTRTTGLEPAASGASWFAGPEQADLEAVLTSSTARLAGNPTLSRQQAIGPFSETPGQFQGWTLAELAILHRYRKRASS